jgi:hypothetical protein
MTASKWAEVVVPALLPKASPRGSGVASSSTLFERRGFIPRAAKLESDWAQGDRG